jgi:hypothetical protein
MNALNEDIRCTICSFLTNKEAIEHFALVCKRWSGVINWVYSSFSDKDYEDICKGVSIKLLNRIVTFEGIKLSSIHENRSILKYIIKKGYLIILKHMEQKRPLFNWNFSEFLFLKYAIEKKSLEIIPFFLSKIKDITTEGKNDLLNIAIDTNDEDLIQDIADSLKLNVPEKHFSFKTLLDRGLYEEAKNRLVQKKLVLKKWAISQIIYDMIDRGRGDVIKLLLNFYFGKSIDSTPLMKALITKQYEIAKILVESKKVDVVVKCGEKVKVVENKPIILAASNGWIDIIKMMIELGADPAAQDNSPIIEASRCGHYKVVKFLMSLKGVDPSACENYALDSAKRCKHKKIVRLLKTNKNVKKLL